MYSTAYILGWFLIANSIIFAQQWWIPLSPTLRLISLFAIYIATGLLLLRWHFQRLDVLVV